MSLVTLIRDYVDVANSPEKLDGYTFSSVTYHIIIFLFTVVKQAAIYCFTFHWLQDLSYFCLTPPSFLSFFENVHRVQDQPLSHLLAFSDFSFSTGMGIIVIGFFNGCFSCMHISAAHIVTIQRMLVQGVPAGFSSAFGTALGQFSFLACVLFGFRAVLLSWIALEPFHFLIGTGILLSVASAMAQDRRTPTIQWSAKSALLKYAFTSFILAWCEQGAIFQLMGNLTFGAESTFLETAPFLETTVPHLVQNFSYLLSFFVGSVLGAFLIGFLLQRFIELVLLIPSISQKGIAIYYGLVKQANLPLATLLFAFGFGSLPYYGFDYLITKGFGFVPREPFFQQTLFSPINLVSKTSQTKEASQGRLEDQLALLFTLEGERSKSFAVDTTPFDDGQYLKSNQKRPQTFEDLNYRGEHLWTNRLSRISNIREQANQTQSSFLGPVFSWMRSFLWGDGPSSPTAVGNNTAVSESSYGFANLKNGNLSTFDPYSASNSVQSLSFERNNQNISIKKKELPPEREQIDNYVKEFDRQFDKGFSNFYDADSHSLIEIEDQWQEKRIKEKCYTNPIYTFLLNTEIDAFLKRQPNLHWLSPQEEVLLLKRRQLLGNYYDTLALTNNVSTSEAFDQLVPKSYANATYNHQFKGTLKVARRLFSVKKDFTKTNNNSIDPNSKGVTSRDGDNNGSKLFNDREYDKTKRVKFDQPLFSKEKNNVQQTLFHEELSIDPAHWPNTGFEKAHNSGDKGLSMNLSKFEETILPEQKNIFSLEQAESSPLYAGWDEQLRKFIITNRFQNRTLAGYTFSGFQFSSTQNKGKKPIIFTSWPIPNPVIKNSSDDSLSFPSETTSTRSSPYGLPSGSYASKAQAKKSIENNRNDYSNAERKNFSTDSANSDPLESENLDSDFDSIDLIPQRGTDKASLAPRRSEDKQSSFEVRDKSFKQTKDVLSPSKSEKTNTNLKTIVNNLDQVANSYPSASNSEETKFLDKVDRVKDQNNKAISNTIKKYLSQGSKKRFLFQTEFSETSSTNDMVNALLQWQKLIQENKQLSKEDKQAAKEKISYWPENVHRANWSNELIENDMETNEPTENGFKKQTILWEFVPPHHGGFIWFDNN